MDAPGKMERKPDLENYIPDHFEGGVVKYMTEYTGGSIRHAAIHMIDVQRAMHDMERDVRRFASDLEDYYKADRDRLKADVEALEKTVRWISECLSEGRVADAQELADSALSAADSRA